MLLFYDLNLDFDKLKKENINI